MPKTIEKIAAWGVHIFTSLGLISGFLAMIAITEKAWPLAFFWLFISFIIDGVDGSLARYFKVKEVLPQMNGKNIDYVIDFANYAIIPAFFFYYAEMVSQVWMYPCLAVILLTSALYYGKEGMVADNEYFVGFPVLWNLVVFFEFFVFHNQPLLNIIFVFIFGALHFVPIKFAYPSHSKRYFWLHMIASVLFFLAAAANLYYYPEKILALDLILVGVVVYFGLVAIMDTWFNKKAY
ncbi:MAG: CDP-alcohol phosphatidyltransferase family protein [Bacteroidota bacterium]